MLKRTVRNAAIGALALLLVTAPIWAQYGTDRSKYPGREWIKPPSREALLDMTWEERRAAMAEYKAARLAESQRAGDDLSASGGVRRVASRPSGNVPQRSLGGTIQYDTGTVFGIAGSPSQMLGNRFDFAINPMSTCCFPVEASGSISMITLDMVNTFFGSIVWSLYSDVVGTMAMQVTSMARAGLMTGLNTLSVMSPTTANGYSNTTFLAGVWQFDPTMTGLAVDTGTTGGQGFHAISINDGAVGTGLTTVTTGGMGLNAIFRVTGWVLTPVELQNFEID